MGDGGNEQKQKENELDMDNSVMIMLVSGGERGCRGDKWRWENNKKIKI